MTSKFQKRLDELRSARGKATQGDWVGRVNQKTIRDGSWVLYATNSPTFINDPWFWTEKKRPEIRQVCADADFIALAANEMLWLLSAAEKMQAALDEIDDDLNRLHAEAVTKFADSFCDRIIDVQERARQTLQELDDE